MTKDEITTLLDEIEHELQHAEFKCNVHFEKKDSMTNLLCTCCVAGVEAVLRRYRRELQDGK